MLAEHAEFKALELKDMLTASDGTRKVSMSLSCKQNYFNEVGHF